MATLYVRSTDGSNADNGTTWALAKATLAGVAAIDAAGDNIWVSQVHAESTAGSISIPLAGTVGNHVNVICGNDGAAPPTAQATTGSVSTTGTTNISVTGSAYIYGLIFNAGTTGSPLMLLNDSASSRQFYESCDLTIGGNGASGQVFLGTQASSASGSIELLNCRLKFANASQGVAVGCRARINGGSVISGGTNVTNFIVAPLANRPIDLMVTGFDFTNWASTLNMVLGGSFTSGGKAIFRGCKMPASWTGLLVSAAITNAGFRAEMHDCGNSTGSWPIWIEDCYGSIKYESTLVRTGGASNGTTYSWKMVSLTAVYPVGNLVSSQITIWNATTGSAKTATVEILHDSATNLTDSEVWLELTYLGTSGSLARTVANDCKATFLTTAADQTTSSETWTTTGMSNPNKQKLSVAFTPQVAGPVTARVILAKSSKTIYVDPKLTIS